MAHTTEEFEGLLDLANVRAVEWDGDRVVVRVSKKLPLSMLDDGDIIANNLPDDVDVDVIDDGDEPGRGHYDLLPLADRPTLPEYSVETEPAATDPGDHQQRHRPVQAGVSEIHRDSTGATAGQFAATVIDTSAGEWADDVEAGDTVRVSNNHVYAQINEAEFGDPILQPSPHDGGMAGDEVGQLVGYLPIEDGVRADIAARSISDEDDRPFGLDPGYGHAIYRDDYDGLRGEQVTKTGRTTGVTVGEVQNVSASVNVGLPDGVTVFRDVLITDAMAEGGDSGSPMYVYETGSFAGVLFAGGQGATIFCKVGNIEEDFGIAFEPNGEDPPEEQPEPDPAPWYCRYLRRFLPQQIVDLFC